MLEMQASQRASFTKREETAAVVRAAAQLSEQNRKMSEEEQEKLRRLAEQRFQTQSYLLEQMREKQETKLVDQDRRRQQRLLQEGDAKQFLEEEQRKANDQHLLHLEHRAQLERQMAARCVAKGPNKELMSDVEVQLNRQLLDRAV